jgi:predicted DNA-binding transcriptional regulator AlpA
LLTIPANTFTLDESKHSRNNYFALDATKMQLSDFITLSDAARAAGVSKRTLQSHMKAGTAPRWERFGREVAFSRKELARWKDRHYPEGTPRKGRRREA